MVELLAPAGEYKSFLGAISAGADAVYLAGNMYGARASAVNFSEEEIIKALRYAHLFNRKIYLTVNTLTKNNELDKLYTFLKPLYESGLDGVIVQDAGVFGFIKDNFKDLDIHVSTQAVVTSRYGAEFYRNLGAKRVVLARELTLPEIKDITAAGIETECFIHGAMCYSYSGMCLFSSFLGGNSGNRGRCKGPCRQPYTISDGHEKSKEAYYLSLADMNTVDIIDKLIDAGIYSFKIEGRLKSPSYAAGVTSVYRKYIDFCLENPGKELRISEEDRHMLSVLYSRTSTGRGYYERVNSPKMVTVEKGAYAKVDEDLEKEIIEKYIDNPLKKEVDFVFKALPGEKACLNAETLVNDLPVKVSVSSEEVIEKALKAPATKEDIFKQLKKTGNTDFVLRKCDILTEEAFVPSSLINRLRRDAVSQLEDRIFEETKDSKRSGSDISDNSNDNSKEPFESDKSFELNKDLNESSKSKKQFNEDSECKDLTIPFKRAFVKTADQLKFAVQSDFYDSLTVTKDLLENDDLIKLIKDSSKDVFIELPPVLRSLNEDEFKDLIKFAQDNECVRGVYVNQYDAYALLIKEGFDKKILSNADIYSYNNTSAHFNASLFDEITAPLELSNNEIAHIDERFVCLLYGRAPLMHTANCILKTSGKCRKNTSLKNSFADLRDRLGVDFKVKTYCDEKLCFNTIYNSKPTSLHKYYPALKDRAKGFIFSFTNEETNEVKAITDYYNKLFNGENEAFPYEFTAYHMKNSIF